MPSERDLFFSDGENQRTIESQSFDSGASLCS